MGATTVRVVTEPEEFESLAGAWDGIAEECGSQRSIYLTHEWLSAWWKHFGSGNRLNILLAEKQGRLIGIVPLMVTEYKLGPVKVRFLETIGAANCNYVGLIPPGNREEAVNALLAHLGAEMERGGSFLKLSFVPDDSVFLHILRSRDSLPANNLAFCERFKTLAPYLVLPETRNDSGLPLNKKMQQRLRRELLLLQEEHNFEFRIYTGESLDDDMEIFFDLHQARWQSVNLRGIFHEPGMREFYRDIARRFMERKWLHFSSLRLDGEAGSVIFGFVYGRKFYVATTARDPRWSDYSLGHLHYKFLIKEAIENDLREFDFLQGNEIYKYYWTKSARKYIEVTAVRKGGCTRVRIWLVNKFLRLHRLKAVRKYSLKELYYIYRWQKADKRLKERERRQKEKKEEKRQRRAQARRRDKR